MYTVRILCGALSKLLNTDVVVSLILSQFGKSLFIFRFVVIDLLLELLDALLGLPARGRRGFAVANPAGLPAPSGELLLGHLDVGLVCVHDLARLGGLGTLLGDGGGDRFDDRVAELMALVELDPDLAGRKPGQLSGGQCQRVGIARALAMEPEVLIADEVTSALDVTIQAQIIELLNRLRSQTGLSIIFISHDLALVRSFCHRVAVFEAGRIVEAGSVDTVLSEPQQPYTQTLIASAPAL